MMTSTNCLRSGGLTLGVILLLAVASCDPLEVSDPTAIEDDQLNNPTGAALLRGDALGEFYRAFGGFAVTTGLISDEFTAFTTPQSSEPFELGVDRRDPLFGFSVGSWGTVRRAATVAFSKLESFGPRAHAGEMLALRGHATLLLATNYCPGFPITELEGFSASVGSPVTTGQAYERALADFDAALTFTVDSARLLNFARVGRAAALLGLGRFADAASAAHEVPSEHIWSARYLAAGSAGSLSVLDRNLLVFPQPVSGSSNSTIADREGGNGLDFISADDPRVQVRQYGTADPPLGAGEPMYNAAKYADDGSPIVVASGVQARLIEAEAALAQENVTWLAILNDLRATQISPPLPPLDDPGTTEARLDLLFRERAFWLFATGQRLADLLRLVRLYGRDPESVFPTGQYHQHGRMYGTITSLPFNPSEAGNPASVTGCTGI